jgi:hypothetical protein
MILGLSVLAPAPLQLRSVALTLLELAALLFDHDAMLGIRAVQQRGESLKLGLLICDFRMGLVTLLICLVPLPLQ